MTNVDPTAFIRMRVDPAGRANYAAAAVGESGFAATA
jgi:hypothetical protein